MPKYWSVKTLLVSAAASGNGVVESLALDHAPLTRMVSLGTISSGLGWVTVEKSPPFIGRHSWNQAGPGYFVPGHSGLGHFGLGHPGLVGSGLAGCFDPRPRMIANRQIAIRKPEHLDCILLFLPKPSCWLLADILTEYCSSKKLARHDLCLARQRSHQQNHSERRKLIRSCCVGQAQGGGGVERGVRFRAGAAVGIDGRDQVVGAAIVQEEDALSQSPQRRRAELVSACSALRNVVRQPCAHVVDLKIGEQVGGGVAQTRRQLRGLSGERRRMADRAANGDEIRTSAGDRSRAAGNRRGRRGRSQELHEDREQRDVAGTGRSVSAVGVGDVLRVADPGSVQAVRRKTSARRFHQCRLRRAAGGPAGRVRC